MPRTGAVIPVPAPQVRRRGRQIECILHPAARYPDKLNRYKKHLSDPADAENGSGSPLTDHPAVLRQGLKAEERPQPNPALLCRYIG